MSTWLAVLRRRLTQLGIAAALLLQFGTVFALDIGPLVLRRDGQPGLLGHFRVSDRGPLDASQLTIRLAHADAYAALGLHYERALSSTVLNVEPTMDSALTVLLRPLPPVTADNRPLDVVVVIFEGTTLTTRLFRVDLRSSRQEFAAIDPTALPVAKGPQPRGGAVADLALGPASAAAPPPLTPMTSAQPPFSPAAAASVSSSPSPSASADVARAIEGWAGAWSKRDVEAYAAAYLPDYRGGQPTHAEWLAQRRARILARREIEVGLSELKISIDGARAEARFVQRYRGDQLRQTDRKRLSLVREGGVWLIREETIL